MPVREYECQSRKCGQRFEEYEHVEDPPLKKCKVCKKGKVIRLISLPARAVVPGDPRDEYARVKREAKQIAQKIIKGDEQTINDIYGDGQTKTELPKPKTLDQVKNGKIKRRKA